MGKPEASTRFTTSVRLGGQRSASPSVVFDQSFARMSAGMFDVAEMSVSSGRIMHRHGLESSTRKILNIRSGGRADITRAQRQVSFRPKQTKLTFLRRIVSSGPAVG